jgi:hypothetical protein
MVSLSIGLATVSNGLRGEVACELALERFYPCVGRIPGIESPNSSDLVPLLNRVSVLPSPLLLAEYEPRRMWRLD